MSRWWLLVVPLVLALALGAWVLSLQGGPAVGHPAPTPGSPVDTHAPAEPGPAVAARRATVSGTVLREGAPVEGAVVVARGNAIFTATSDSKGGFQFEVDGPADLLLSARDGDTASAALGPVHVEPAQRLEGLTLVLTPAAILSGTVVDAHSRVPIPEARVRTPAGAQVADAAGRFTVRGLGAGRSWLEAEAKGYLQRFEWLELDATAEQHGLEVALVRAAHVEGRVLRQGTPQPQVAVWAERANASGADRQIPAVSDAEGHFALEVVPGTLQICAAPPGRLRVAGPVLQLSPGQSATADLELAEGLTASGVVRVEGTPLAGAQLIAHDAQTLVAVAAATSGPTGAFTFEGMGAGRYVLTVRTTDGSWDAGPFELGDGSPWLVDLVRGGVLEGKVLPAAAGISVSWVQRSTVPLNGFTTTDAAGRFRFEGVPATLLTVEASGTEGMASTTARAGDAVELRLSHGAIRVAVSAAGKPVTDFHLRAREAKSGAVREVDVMSPRGTWRLDVPPGHWEVWVSARGFSHNSAPAQVEVAGADVELPIELKTGRMITGTVRDHVTSAPLAGAVVRATRRWPGLYDGDDGPSTPTDGSGHYQLGPVVPGSSLVIQKPGYRRGEIPAWQVARLAQGDGVIDLTLAPTDARPEAPIGNEPYEGVGMQLGEQQGKIAIGWVFPAGPAEAAGVRQGDILLAVDAVPVAPPVDPVVGRVRGPAGSVVRLSLQRGNDRLEAPVRRASIRQ